METGGDPCMQLSHTHWWILSVYYTNLYNKEQSRVHDLVLLALGHTSEEKQRRGLHN